ncbi:MAG: HNH endonuclease signature motif containing protein [Acidimicrobiales bacterium]|jgi:hypothetical protein
MNCVGVGRRSSTSTSAEVASALNEALKVLNRPDPVDAPISRSFKQRQHDALGDLANSFLGGPSSSDGPAASDHATDPPAKPARRSRSTGVVLVDLDTFVEPAAWRPGEGWWSQESLGSITQDLVGSGPIPRRTADLLTCDADIKRLVIDSHGQPLNLGRSTPTVTSSQRQAQVIRDGGCVFPTCDRPAHWCDAHHIQPRSLDGPTNVDNLALLCRHHRRAVHGPNWTLERHPVTGEVWATRRDGTVYRRGPDGLVRPQRE